MKLTHLLKSMLLCSLIACTANVSAAQSDGTSAQTVGSSAHKSFCKLVAHRGGSKLGPENRSETFDEAMRQVQYLDAIELDIHPSSDGELMVIHDETLDRTFGQSGTVCQMSSQQLRDAGVPTLRQVLQLTSGHCQLFIEIKTPHKREFVPHYQGLEEALVSLLQEPFVQPQPVVISFDEKSLSKVHQLAPRIATGLLCGQLPDLKHCQQLGVRYIAPHYKCLSPEWMAQAHRQGFMLNAWTVNSSSAMRELIQWGCDAITTDDPLSLQDCLFPAHQP